MFIRIGRGSAYKPPPPGAVINWSHSLARGLIGAWLFHYSSRDPGSTDQEFRGRRPITLIHPQIEPLRYSLDVVHTTEGIRAAPIGPSGSFVVDRDQTNHAGPWRQMLPPITVAWRVNQFFAFNDSALHYYWGHADADPVTAEFTCQKFSDNNWYVGYSKTGADTRLSFAASEANLALRQWQSYVFTSDSSGSAFLRNGVPIASTSTAPNPGTMNHPFAWFNIDPQFTGSAGLSNNSYMSYGYIWNRKLSQQEAEWLHVEPYAFLSRPKSIFFPASTLVAMPGRRYFGIRR